MIIYYGGKYDGDETKLPHRKHEENYHAFDEPQGMQELLKIVNIISGVITVVSIGLLWLRAGYFVFDLIGIILSFLSFVPHELLHALCFKEEAYIYQNLKQGIMFVVGNEAMSKFRFVMLSLCPNIIIGLIPFLLFMIDPTLEILGTLGALALAMGAGDYYNVYNALTQMPKGAKTYINGMHSYWYLPKDEGSL